MLTALGSHIGVKETQELTGNFTSCQVHTFCLEKRPLVSVMASLKQDWKL